MARHKRIYTFKAGQLVPLDVILNITTPGVDTWWEAPDPADRTEDEDIATILVDVKITIIVDT